MFSSSLLHCNFRIFDYVKVLIACRHLSIRLKCKTCGNCHNILEDDISKLSRISKLILYCNDRRKAPASFLLKLPESIQSLVLNDAVLPIPTTNSWPSLKELRLEECSNASPMLAKLSPTQLKSLTLREPEDSNMLEIGNALHRYTALFKFSIILEAEQGTLQSLATSMNTLTSQLKYLDLRLDNGIKEDSVSKWKLLLSIIRRCPNLEELSLAVVTKKTMWKYMPVSLLSFDDIQWLSVAQKIFHLCNKLSRVNLLYHFCKREEYKACGEDFIEELVTTNFDIIQNWTIELMCGDHGGYKKVWFVDGDGHIIIRGSDYHSDMEV